VKFATQQKCKEILKQLQKTLKKFKAKLQETSKLQRNQ
jgi:hypothetical protein